MGCVTKSWLVVLFAIYMQHHVLGEPQVPCLFIFGDSLSDCGNNNKLATAAKANYLPYGIDFPAGPTGRFTDGRTSVDIITQLLGFEKFIPPYANTDGSDILLGVNYASGAAGIRNETGTHLGEDISLGMQLQHHKDIVSQIAKKLGSSNDYLNNYFLPEHYQSNRMYSPDQFAGALVQQYSTQLQALHNLGARKFALIGLNPLGCVPYEITTHKKIGSICVDEENKAAFLFNDKLKALVDRFNTELSDSKFIFINSAIITRENIQLPDIVSCCKLASSGQCVPGEVPCLERILYGFFDAFHPTEKGNQFSAISAYNSPFPSYAYPMDISHLVKL
ncbi:SGNH hydrolase superfamily [Sesbania bispinosa]|nr:SGNH hydrolase superfamily [Sesbania bispinosa]